MIILVLTIVMVTLCCVVGFNLVGGSDLKGKEVYVLAESNNDKQAPVDIMIHGGNDLADMCGMRVELSNGNTAITGKTDESKTSFSIGERVPIKFGQSIKAGTYDANVVGIFRDGKEVTLYMGPLTLDDYVFEFEDDGKLLFYIRYYASKILFQDFTYYGTSDDTNADYYAHPFKDSARPPPMLKGKVIDEWHLNMWIEGEPENSTKTFVFDTNNRLTPWDDNVNYLSWPRAPSSWGPKFDVIWSKADDNTFDTKSNPANHYKYIDDWEGDPKIFSATYTAYNGTSVVATSTKSVTIYPKNKLSFYDYCGAGIYIRPSDIPADLTDLYTIDNEIVINAALYPSLTTGTTFSFSIPSIKQKVNGSYVTVMVSVDKDVSGATISSSDGNKVEDGKSYKIDKTKFASKPAYTIDIKGCTPDSTGCITVKVSIDAKTDSPYDNPVNHSPTFKIVNYPVTT